MLLKHLICKIAVNLTYFTIIIGLNNFNRKKKEKKKKEEEHDGSLCAAIVEPTSSIEVSRIWHISATVRSAKRNQ